MFALFALIGGLASFSTWIGGVFVAHRARRAARIGAGVEADTFAAAAGAAGEAVRVLHRRRYPDVTETLGVHDRPFAVGDVSRVWSVRATRSRR